MITQDETVGMPAPDAAIRYFQRPKPYSAELELTLTATALFAERGKSKQEFPLRSVERIRLRFTPKNSVFYAFTCDVRAKDGKSIRFENVSWKSLIENERMNDSYVRFIRILVERVTRANPGAELHAGISTFRHGGMIALGALLLLGLSGCVVYALLKGNIVVGLMALVLVGYLGFWLYETARRNRPRAFTRETIPPDLLPK